MADGRDAPDVLRTLDRVTFDATVHLLLAGFALIGAGLADIRGSTGLVALLLALAVGLFTHRDRVPTLGTVAGHDLGRLVAELWVAAASAAATTAVALGASPGELQALGGLLGLVAVVNYFLRPVYYLAYSLVAKVLDPARAEGS